jgi:hypothetical protein
MMTRSSVIYAECYFYTHCDFKTHECDYDPHDCDVNTHKKDLCMPSVIFIWKDFDTNEYDNARVWFLHEECYFHTHCAFDTLECDHDIHDCGFNMHKKDFYTQSVILDTYECDFYTQSVVFTCLLILTRMNVTTTLTYECDYDTQECELYTHELNFNTMRVILTSTKTSRKIYKKIQIGFWLAAIPHEQV